MALAGALGTLTSAQTPELTKPGAPLLIAGGETVQVAWSLPEGPKLEIMVIYRTTKAAPQLVEVGRVAARRLTFTDDDVRLGQTYQYRIQAFRGMHKSAMSDVSEVRVGGTAQIAFLGGSPERAVFEVSMFTKGSRVTAQFVHSPGDVIGDLAYVEALETIVDFRIGPRLVGMEIGDSTPDETQRETLKDAQGEPMRAPGGGEIELEFIVPGREYETLIATLRDTGGRTFTLREGETWKSD